MNLHTYAPQPIAFSLGPIDIYFYGLIVVSGIMAAILVSTKLATKYKLKPDLVPDLAFYLIFGGLVGARLYDILLELPYYLKHPLDIFKIWQGGLAIHGALIAGALVLFFYVRKKGLEFWQLASIILPGIALGQAIGRWGNYFNQELFGRPTDLPWGIFIDIQNRPAEFLIYQYYHPTFLYESIGCLFIFGVLLFLHKKLSGQYKYLTIISTYFITYSILRFSLEFIKVDSTPTIGLLRWPQIMSLIIIGAVIAVNYSLRKSITHTQH
jgi:phosphatidylglycerol:prolipoprotein diacylglycerol transferase